MQEIVAYCGLVCTECPAYKATQEDDNGARAKVAEAWSKQFKHNFKTEDINCNGCLAVGEIQFSYLCNIRRCGVDRKVLNCAYCVEYPCDKLSNFLTEVPEARAKLEAIRSKK
jgi:hypothetical protein